jgi:hypothetical protein
LLLRCYLLSQLGETTNTTVTCNPLPPINQNTIRQVFISLRNGSLSSAFGTDLNRVRTTLPWLGPFNNPRHTSHLELSLSIEIATALRNNCVFHYWQHVRQFISATAEQYDRHLDKKDKKYKRYRLRQFVLRERVKPKKAVVSKEEDELPAELELYKTWVMAYMRIAVQSGMVTSTTPSKRMPICSFGICS